MSDLSFAFAHKKLSQEGELEMKVVTDSMEPLISVGDIVKVQSLGEKPLEMFDIIVYWDNQKWVSHFIWFVDDSSEVLVTRSLRDPVNNDFPIKRSDILGKVTNFKISFGRRLLIALKNRF